MIETCSPWSNKGEGAQTESVPTPALNEAEGLNHLPVSLDEDLFKSKSEFSLTRFREG